MIQKTELVFLNSHSAMGIPRPSNPSIVEIGGMHISPSKRLPDDLQEFLDSAHQGAIFFSLGSVMPENTLDHFIINGILNTFKKLKLKILMKWKGDLQNIPSNVKIGNWFPQQDILSK